ncbi:MAG: mersacidin/lichenicidin family type 2 lantibiotic [Chloroflexi bacterium]|nr:mersacidin/lichenicidin family type 2 lantibiotic [Chloroflexota bacterium]
MKLNAIRVWKNEAYRASLSKEMQSMLSERSVGSHELSDAELESVLGGCNGSDRSVCSDHSSHSSHSCHLDRSEHSDCSDRSIPSVCLATPCHTGNIIVLPVISPIGCLCSE